MNLLKIRNGNISYVVQNERCVSSGVRYCVNFLCKRVYRFCYFTVSSAQSAKENGRYMNLDPGMLWAQMFLEIQGWYVEKLYVKLRYQGRDEPVTPNGLRDPSFRSICLCVGWVKGPGLAN